MVSLTRSEILSYYDLFPFEKHPLWQAILAGDLTLDEVLRAEQQHFLRSDIGRHIRKRAAEDSASISITAHELLMETYREECTDDDTGPSHVDLVRRLLLEGGLTEAEIVSSVPTPGNIAAIALYKDIADRGPLHHMIGAGAVEFFYSRLSPKIFSSYISNYSMTEYQAETYRIHGPMDQTHAERALSVIDDPTLIGRESEIMYAVRDAFVATSLHYDGMLQAATGHTKYWSGA